jgi:uncharacterized protein YndB with AHSA1/START domain
MHHPGSTVVVDLKHQIDIKASPEQVYAALTAPDGLASWWTADVQADQKVGGKAEFGFHKRSAVYRMTIVALDLRRQVVWSCQGDNPEWTGTTLTWTITSDGAGSILRFTHGGWKSATGFFAMCNSTWGELMYRLKGYLEGNAPGPRWTE